jgi:hypothetical protein
MMIVLLVFHPILVCLLFQVDPIFIPAGEGVVEKLVVKEV